MRRGGSEDPWLCVTDFGQYCLCQDNCAPLRKLVNSGMYILSGEFRVSQKHDLRQVEEGAKNGSKVRTATSRDYRIFSLAKSWNAPCMTDGENGRLQ